VEIDDDQAVHGRQSLRFRVKAADQVPRSRQYKLSTLRTETTSSILLPDDVEEETDFTFSAYMKSDKPHVKIRTFLTWDHTKYMELTTDWQRYVFTAKLKPDQWYRMKTGKKAIDVAIHCATETFDHSVWIDAVQIEKGTRATDYRPSQIDKPDVAHAPVAEQFVPRDGGVEYSLRATDSPPTIDGDLSDPCWEKAEKIESFKRWKEDIPASVQTRAALLRDEKNLYVGIWCDEPEMDRVRAVKTRRDDNVHRDDCVEVFLDTNRDRRTHLQFIVNTLGTVQDVKRSEAGDEFASLHNNVSWDARWEARVRKQEGMWTVELLLPFSSLELTSETQPVWGLNICRENHKLQEYSAWAYPDGRFDTATPRFGLLKGVPREILSAYCIDISDMRTEPLDLIGGLYRIDFNLKNETGNNGTYRVRISVQTPSGRVLSREKEARVLKNGTRRVVFQDLPLTSQGSENGMYSLTAQVLNASADTVLAEKRERLFLYPVFRIYPEKSYYTGEHSAILLAEVNGRKRSGGPPLKVEVEVGASLLRLELDAQPGDVLRFPVKTALLPRGNTPVTARLYSPAGTTMDTSACSITRLPPGPGSEVKIDHRRRMFLVDEDPFFLYFQGFHDVGDYPGLLDGAKENAFNGVVTRFESWAFVNRPDLRNQREREGMKRAQELGMKILFWLRPSEMRGSIDYRKKTGNAFLAGKTDAIETVIRDTVPRLKDCPALFGWIIMDEWWDEAYGKRLYDLCKELDPYHPAIINFAGNEDRFWANYGEAWWKRTSYYTDAISWTMYPFGHETGSMLRTYMEPTLQDIMEMMSRKEMVPKLLWGQMLILGYRAPLPEEQQAYMYLALVNQVKGVYYFMGMPEAVSLWKVAGVLGRELKALAPVLAIPPLAQGILDEDPDLYYSLIREGSRLTLILVNIGNEEKPVRFSLSGLSVSPEQEAAVLFEGRHVPIEDGVLSDRIGALGRHVYIIE